MQQTIFSIIIILTVASFPKSVLSERNNFWIENKGIPCFLITLDANITIRYANTSGATKVITEEVAALNPNQLGQCNDTKHPDTSEIIIQTKNSFNLTLNFKQYADEVVFENASVGFSYGNPVFVNPSKTGKVKLMNSPQYHVGLVGEYFECDSFQVMFTKDANLTIKYVKVQAFNVVNGNYSENGIHCKDSSNSTTEVPTETPESSTTDITSTPESSTTDITSTPESSTTDITSTPESSTTDITSTPESSSSTIFPTPSANPTTSPYPKYHVEGNGTVCLLLSMRFSLQLTNPTPINKEKASRTFHTNNITVESSGVCSSNVNNITLAWSPNESPSDVFNLALTFEQNPASTYALGAEKPSFALTEIVVDYVVNNKTFPESKTQTDSNRRIVYLVPNFKKVPVGSSYTCVSEITYSLDKSNKVTFDHFEVEAFRTSTSETFDPKGAQCSEDDKPTSPDNVVPIVVGVVLAALVIVVLIAYLIGRRRHRAGYDNI